MRLREELDAFSILAERLRQLAQQQNDPELLALANDLAQTVDDARAAYHAQYLDALEQATGTDLDENDYYESVEREYDQQIEQDYGVSVAELEQEESTYGNI